MKVTCLLVILLYSVLGKAQSPIVASLDTEKYKFSNDSIRIKSLNMLSKITPDYDLEGTLMPRSYNWTSDVRRMESLKRMSLRNPQQDAYGRDMPIDVFEQVRVDLLQKSFIFHK